MRNLPIFLCIVLIGVPGAATATPPSPDEFLGMALGADRVLADYDQVGAYFQELANSSDRVELESIGDSVLGRPIWMAVISSAGNLAASHRHRQIAKRLADPRGLTSAEETALIAEGKAIVLVTCNIHSTEIGASQMAMELAWELATTDDPQRLKILDDVILLLLPSINPDGQQMVVDWYRQWIGTEFEGGRMPWLYHHYAGHDNNRDWFMLNLPETRAVNRVLYHEWFPQVYLDEHQMGYTGPRIFVPPFQDPIGENIHPLIWRLTDLFGTEMAVRLQEAGKQGVIDGYAYDGYWPGGTMNTAWWKNVVGLLTELASVKIATPIRVEPNELRGSRKGLPEYRTQVNFPDPWPGGTWTLRDIIDYEKIATYSLMETASRHRADLLRDMAQMARDAVQAGRENGPFAYAIPPDQRDPGTAATLVDLLLEHGIEVHRATRSFVVNRRVHPAGSLVVRMDQPYRAFAKEMLEAQRFPEVMPETGGEILPPYDVTGWTLPYLMGVEGSWIDEPFEASLELLSAAPFPEGSLEGEGRTFLLSRQTNAAARAVNRLLLEKGKVRTATRAFETAGQSWPAGTYRISGLSRAVLEIIVEETGVTLQAAKDFPDAGWRRLDAPRVALYKPWRASMDEGWTRLVLEGGGFAFESLNNAAVIEGDLSERYDAIVLPDVDTDWIVEGRRAAGDERRYTVELPPDYRGGIGEEGTEALKKFVEAGGTLVALDSSASFAMAKMNLPVRNVLAKVPASEFLCPGSILRMQVDTSHPLGYGLPAEIAGYFASSPAFATQIPGAEATRQVVVRYPEQDPLLSGFLRGEKRLRRRASVVEVELGEGRVDLLGFRVQNRGWTHGTFRLLFNALERAAWREER